MEADDDDEGDGDDDDVDDDLFSNPTTDVKMFRCGSVICSSDWSVAAIAMRSKQ